MNGKEKADKILTFIESGEFKSPESKAIETEARINERTAFVNVLIDNLKAGSVLFPEAQLRASKFAQSDVEKNYILARIAEFEIPVGSLKTASHKEVRSMDPITEILTKLRAKGVSRYADYLERSLKKDGFYLGTGDKVQPNAYDIGSEKAEDATNIAQQKEGDSRMKTNEKKREEHLRADAKAETKKAWHMGTGDKVDSKKWDNGSEAEEAKRMSAEQKEGESQRKEDAGMRAEHLRASKDMFSVRFVRSEEGIKESAWEIVNKKSGDLLVRAAVSDITGNRDDIDAGALEDVASPSFGEVIYEDIADHGLETTARNLLGPTFEKLAKAYKAPKSMSHGKTDEWDGKGKDIGFGKTEEHVKEASAEVDMEKLATQYFTYRGIYSDLSNSLSKIAKEHKLPALAPVIAAVGEALDVVQEGIDQAKPVPEISGAMGEVEQSLGTMNTIEEKLMKAIELAQGNAELEQLLNEVLSEQKSEEAAEGETGAIDLAPAPATEGEAEMDIEIPAEGEKEEKDEEKDEKKEEKDEKTEEKAEGKKVETSLKDRLRKLAGKDSNEKNYDVTPKANFQSDFHSKSLGKIKQDGDHFHSIWELAKQFHTLGLEKATGKMAEFLANVKTAAEKSGMSYPEYLSKILGDKAYVSAYTSKMTPEKIEAEHNSLAKDTNVYAAVANKTKLAYKASLGMVTRGILKSGAVDSQVDKFLAMDEKTFNSYIDSLENIAPTTEIEDGRVRVEAMSEVDERGNVVHAFVDGIPVANLNKTELNMRSAKVTKADLLTALKMTKIALKEGFFDDKLTDGRVGSNEGETLGNLNLGVEETKTRGIQDL